MNATAALEHDILSLLADKDLTCDELLEETEAGEFDMAVALWNLVRKGKVKFTFDHWESI